jgi:hypothetical protein
VQVVNLAIPAADVLIIVTSFIKFVSARITTKTASQYFAAFAELNAQDCDPFPLASLVYLVSNALWVLDPSPSLWRNALLAST